MRILCYGDSNTYGYNPADGRRYDEATRWPGRLQALLGAEHRVIEEGLSGRTTVFCDPVEGGCLSGLDYLPPCLLSHNPLDVVAIMLGTNDLKQRFGMSAHTIAHSAMQLIECARRYATDADGRPARVLLIAPPQIGDWLDGTPMGPMFGAGAVEISRGLAHAYEKVARLLRCDFLDAARFASPSPLDAVHLSAQSQHSLAAAVADALRDMGTGGRPPAA